MNIFSDKSILYFKAVCDFGGIRQAATALNISPSAISRQITLLEDKLKVELFVRRGNSMVITPYGKQLLNYSKEEEKREQHLIRDMKGIKLAKSGEISIAIGEGFVTDVVKNLLVPMQKQYPNIKVHIHTHPLQGIYKALQDGVADIGLTYNFLMRDEFNLINETIQPLCAIVPANHSKAKIKNATLKDFVDTNIAMPDESHSVCTSIIKTAEMQGIKLTPNLICNSLSPLISCVAEQTHIVFLPEFCVKDYIDSGIAVAVQLQDLILKGSRSNIIAHKNSYLSPAVKVGIKIIKENMSAFN